MRKQETVNQRKAGEDGEPKEHYETLRFYRTALYEEKKLVEIGMFPLWDKVYNGINSCQLQGVRGKILKTPDNRMTINYDDLKF